MYVHVHVRTTSSRSSEKRVSDVSTKMQHKAREIFKTGRLAKGKPAVTAVGDGNASVQAAHHKLCLYQTGGSLACGVVIGCKTKENGPI